MIFAEEQKISLSVSHLGGGHLVLLVSWRANMSQQPPPTQKKICKKPGGGVKYFDF